MKKITILLAAVLLMGCGAAKKTARSDITEKEAAEQITERKDITRETTTTDSTKEKAAEVTKTIIEFSIPAEPIKPPDATTDPKLYEQYLLIQLISRISKIEQEVSRTSELIKGTNTTDNITDQSITEESKQESQKDEIKESASDPVEITPGWVKGVRTIALILIILIAVFLFIRYGRHLLPKTKK